MSYPALPDRRLSFDNDGTVLASRGYNTSGGGVAYGLQNYLSGSDRILLNGISFTNLSDADMNTGSGLAADVDKYMYLWAFFPEQREVTALMMGGNNGSPWVSFVVQGSNDTTNGVDGTWETASQSGSSGLCNRTLDGWRTGIRSISFTGPKHAIRIVLRTQSGTQAPHNWQLLHIYGEKTTGQTPDDLIFIDHDTTPGAEYAAPEDFGDRPLGTSVVRQFRVKNVSPTLTANSINIQCNDSDFAISTDGVTWVVTINIASLAAGAESATLYIRNTTPDPGAPLGPRFARIVAIVGSWS